MDDPLVLGVDIGGSHITAGLVDLTARGIIDASVSNQKVSSDKSADEILSCWCETIKSACGGSVYGRNIGIAIPGPFDYKNGICLIKEQDKFKFLYGIDVKSELAHRLDIPSNYLLFTNDALAFLQGEVFAGAARGHNNVLGITLGTGLGSAFYLQDEVRDADLWHSPLYGTIAEDHLAAGWFLRRYYELTGRIADGVKAIAETVNTEPEAKQVFTEFGKSLGEFLQPLIARYDLETVILGGSISNAFGHFSDSFTQEADQWHKKIPVKVSVLKENSALIGAASLWHVNILNGNGLLNYK